MIEYILQTQKYKSTRRKSILKTGKPLFDRSYLLSESNELISVNVTSLYKTCHQFVKFMSKTKFMPQNIFCHIIVVVVVAYFHYGFLLFIRQVLHSINIHTLSQSLFFKCPPSNTLSLTLSFYCYFSLFPFITFY